MVTHSIPKNDILGQLSRILRSRAFRNSGMLRNFLSFVVQEAIKEEGMDIKQYTVAVQAFGRNPDFDATTDPIVRIQASRLRRNLDLYYQEEGQDDKILISLKKGSYAPEIEYKTQSDEQVVPKSSVGQKVFNSLAVFPIKNLSANQSDQYIVEGFNEELLMELSLYKGLSVIRVHDELNDLTKQSLARFSLEGSIRFGEDVLKISISVTDNLNHQVIWSYQEKFDLNDYDLIKIQEDVATSVTRQIAGESGIILNKLYHESNWDKTHSSRAYATYIHLYRYHKNPTEKNAFELLEKITGLVDKEPDFAPGWSVLSNLFIDAYMFGLDLENLKKGLEYGKKAVTLQPENQVCQIYYAYSLLVNDQLEESIVHFQKALSLNPNSIFYSGAVGWAFCLLNKLEEGSRLIRKSMELDFQYPKWFHLGLFLYHMDKKDYNRALVEANQMDAPDLYWGYLLRLVASYKLSLLDSAKEHLIGLTEVKPDFFNRRREYVHCLVKSKILEKEIVESVEAIVRLSEKE